MKKFPWWSLLFLLPFALGLYVALSGDAYKETERAVYEFMKHPVFDFDAFWYAFTYLGSAVGAIGVTVVIFVTSLILQISGKKALFSFGMPVTITVIASRIVNMVVKELVGRSRPEWMEFAQSENSFPSGHAMNNMALYIALLIVILLVVAAPKWKIFFTLTLIGLPLIIGISRIYFGVHYVSDVVAGWGLGAFIALTSCYIYFKIYNKIKERNNANRISF
jgi:undecaprenyl-diphosphatase